LVAMAGAERPEGVEASPLNTPKSSRKRAETAQPPRFFWRGLDPQ
jgi:hypothetical protein